MAEYDPRPNVREICEDNIHRKLEYINKANASLLSAYEAGRSDALEFCLDFIIIKNVISNESKKELSRDRRIMRDMHSRWKNFHKSTQKYDAPSDEKSLAYLAGHDTTTTRYRDDRKELLSIKTLSKYCATVAHDVWIP